MALLESGLRFALIIAGLLWPGWGWAKAASVPLRSLAAGLGSILLLFLGVLALQAFSLPITLPSLTVWLLLTGLPGWWLSHRRHRPPMVTQPAVLPLGWGWLLAAPALVVAAHMSLIQPLSGDDHVFRWEHLARLIFTHHHLDFYPPVSSADFSMYVWADGIAPLVSATYAWCFLGAGNSASVWTAPAVIAQVIALFMLAAQLAGLFGARVAASFAWGIMATSTLLQFAFNIGQETGLTAIGAGAMVYYLLHWNAQPERRSLLIYAALGGAVAACAREYGGIGAFTAGLWIWRTKGDLRSALVFTVGAALPAMVWHLRNAVLTGNPFFSHDLASLPTNPVFAQLMSYYRAVFGMDWHSAGSWLELLRLFALNALLPMAGLVTVVATRRMPSAARTLLGAVSAGFSVAWLFSISSTAGGLHYSMRVLSPVLLLGAVGGGAWLSLRTRELRLSRTLLVALFLLSLVASIRAWVYPYNPVFLSPAQWPVASRDFRAATRQDTADFIEQTAQQVNGRILSDHLYLYGYLKPHEVTASPFWSPEVAWLFTAMSDEDLDAGTRLINLGFSHILLTKSDLFSLFLQQHHAFENLKRCLVAEAATAELVLYRIRPRPAPDSAP